MPAEAKARGIFDSLDYTGKILLTTTCSLHACTVYDDDHIEASWTAIYSAALSFCAWVAFGLPFNMSYVP